MTCPTCEAQKAQRAIERVRALAEAFEAEGDLPVRYALVARRILRALDGES